MNKKWKNENIENDIYLWIIVIIKLIIGIIDNN